LFVAASTRTSTWIGFDPPMRVTDAVLQHAQHLRLRRQAHVADLVEEERSAVRLLEFPGAIRHGAGERALHVAEQLALDQLRWDRGAVHLDERRLRARALRVDRARHELLPRAVLRRDQHARRRLAYALDLLDHRADRVRRADDLERERTTSRSRVFSSCRSRCASAFRSVTRMRIGVERLLEDVVRAVLCRLDGGLDRRVAADHDDDGARILLPQLLKRLEAVDPRHLHVHEDEVRLESRILGEAIDRIRDGAHLSSPRTRAAGRAQRGCPARRRR
jgi:hypothetical protein